MKKLILDLTRPEGARILEEDYFLYQYVEKVKSIVNDFLNYDGEEDTIEFFSTNIFINGSRGAGKTSVLLTVYKELKSWKDLLVLPIIDLSTNVQSILIYLLSFFKKYYYEKLDSETCCEKKT